MRNGTPGFQPGRLVEVREARGLTQTTLARLAERSSSAVSKWERGDQTPDPEALEKLAKAVDVRPSFFLLPPSNHGDTPRFFRSMASATQAARKKADVRLRWVQDISLKLQESVDLPFVDIPTVDEADFRAISDAEIEKMAEKCRRHWRMGDGPISDMVLVMENAGAIVAFDRLDTSTMDGLSNWSELDGRPYVLLASDKSTCVRSRMDAAHELGHLVLHRHVDMTTLNKRADFAEIERQAFLFASAFLMPSESFADEVTYPALDVLATLKERWMVSIAAMVMRCHTLEMIDDFQKTQLFKSQSQRGWRKQEPLDDKLPLEVPRILSRSIRLLVEEHVFNKGALLDKLRLSPRDVEELTSLPEGYLSRESAEVMPLPRLKVVGTPSKPEERPSKEESTDNVIHFPLPQKHGN